MEYTDDEWHKIMSTNLESCFAFVRLAYPMLKATGDSCIVNIGSVAGVTAMRTGGRVHALSLGGLFCIPKR